MTKFVKLAVLVPLVACGGIETPSDQNNNQASGGADEDGTMDDGGKQAATFRLRIENVAPWTMLKSGTVGSAPMGPGEAFEIRFTGNRGQAISFATMLGESNDWFFAPGPAGIPLFTEDGRPNTGDVTRYVALWDAGTELDQEPAVGDATAPQQPAPDFGAADPDPRIRVLAGTIELDTGKSFTLPAVAAMIRVTLAQGDAQEWILRVENVSTASTLCTSLGRIAIHLSPAAWSLHILSAPLFEPGKLDRGQGLEQLAEAGNPRELGPVLAKLSGFHTPLSPGVFVIHRDGMPLFTVGLRDRGDGLEHIAEDGNPARLAETLTANAGMFVAHGVFDTPVGAMEPGIAAPGHAYEVMFDAVAGVDRLSLVTMFGMSNDWFFGTTERGAVIEAGTLAIALYDAGTEIDEEPAIGPFTGPQQPAPDTGPADPDPRIGPIAPELYGVPATEHLRVTLERVSDRPY